MNKKITVPQLPDMDSATLVAWEKGPGDKVQAGDVLYEIETDKVVSQIESDVEGILKQQFFEEGDQVKPGDIIAELD